MIITTPGICAYVAEGSAIASAGHTSSQATSPVATVVAVSPEEEESKELIEADDDIETTDIRPLLVGPLEEQLGWSRVTRLSKARMCTVCLEGGFRMTSMMSKSSCLSSSHAQGLIQTAA